MSTRTRCASLLLSLVVGCSAAPQAQTFSTDGGAIADLGAPDIAGCDTFTCLGVLGYGNKAASSVASSCVAYKTNMQPSPVCQGCACAQAKSDCTITASTWADSTCSTTLVDRKSVGSKDSAAMSTYNSYMGYAKVESAVSTCVVDATVKGGPVYSADDKYICNYFEPCNTLECAAASEAQCLLLAGNVQCPAAFPLKESAFGSVDDKRTCTCDCVSGPTSCALPSGASAYLQSVVLKQLGVVLPACQPAGKPVTGAIEVQDYKTVCCR